MCFKEQGVGFSVSKNTNKDYQSVFYVTRCNMQRTSVRGDKGDCVEKN